MARVGFKKTYAPGTFDKAAVQALFGQIRTHLASAGFTLLIDTAEAVDFLCAGSPAGTADDDTPHWALAYSDLGEHGQLTAYAVHGLNYQDAGARSNSNRLIHTGFLPQPTPELTLWFAADGNKGWWWLHAAVADPESRSGQRFRYTGAGVTSRRYPADMHQGLCTRYGLWDDNGDWYPAYALLPDGALNTSPWTGTWSPFGEGWSNNGERHPGSPLPKMAVPQFPNRDGGISACLLGEFNEILILTDGYSTGEAPVPGFIAFVGAIDDQPYAVPAPPQFVDPDAPPGPL